MKKEKQKEEKKELTAADIKKAFDEAEDEEDVEVIKSRMVFVLVAECVSFFLCRPNDNIASLILSFILEFISSFLPSFLPSFHPFHSPLGRLAK